MDEYLEKLKRIQEDIQGVDVRLTALERGFALDAVQVDAFVEANRSKESARYEDFLSRAEIQKISDDYDEALKKGAECDIIDYSMAVLCGIVSGVLDVTFASAPHEGELAKSVDDIFDKSVMKLAKLNGWNPRPGKEKEVASAIGFLERHYAIGYDQTTSKSIGDAIEHMSTKSHHAKSAGHYPDFFGLIASISDQFAGVSTFYNSENGTIIHTGSTNGITGLQGETFIEKLFYGTMIWFWHCISDIVGSSGTRGNGGGHIGTGLPLPMTEFLQLFDFVKFKEEKGHDQAFGTVITKVFEEGYDSRHGITMSVPVALNGLLIRAYYVIRKHYCEGIEWNDSLPQKDDYDLNRMMTVGIGSFCLVDVAHATVTSWGNWVAFFSKLNLVGWSRLGAAGIEELKLLTGREKNNIVKIQDQISGEWDRLLDRSKALLTE